MEVSRDTFKESDESTKQLILFDSIQEVSKQVGQFCNKCEETHDEVDLKIKKASRTNKYFSGAGGVIGGILSAISLKFLS